MRRTPSALTIMKRGGAVAHVRRHVAQRFRALYVDWWPTPTGSGHYLGAERPIRSNQQTESIASMDSGWVRKNSYEGTAASISRGHVTPLPFVGSDEELLEAL